MKKIIGTMEVDIEPTILNQANNEIRNQYLSAKKAKEQLGWSPKYTLDLSLVETVEWYKSHFKS